MNPPEFFYPVKPWRINQGWGVKNPLYEKFGFSRHNGIDVAPGINKLISAPFKGTIYAIGNQPKGGGIYAELLSEETYLFPDGVKARVLLSILHCEKILAKLDVQYQVGDDLAIADNTGESTGPHTHFQPRRVSYDGRKITFLDKNDANNSFDPTPYFNGKFALDEKITLLKTALELLKQVLGYLTKG